MEFKNYINGEWVASSDGATFEQRNPADLDEVTGLWPLSPRADAVAAIDAAQAAFPTWRDMGVHRRAEHLKRALALMVERRDQVAAIVTMENGKTLLWQQRHLLR